MTPQERDDILHMVARSAVECEARTGVPAEVTAAQAILESGWLNRAPGFNCFGIKAHSGVSGQQLMTTTEWFTDAEARAFLNGQAGRELVPYNPRVVSASGRTQYKAKDWFAKYESLADAFADHARVLKLPVYHAAWEEYRQSHDLDRFIDLVSAKYATDPQYAQTVKQLAHGPHMTAAIVSARSAVNNV